MVHFLWYVLMLHQGPANLGGTPPPCVPRHPLGQRWLYRPVPQGFPVINYRKKNGQRRPFLPGQGRVSQGHPAIRGLSGTKTLRFINDSVCDLVAFAS